jgi:hypothetical protein
MVFADANCAGGFDLRARRRFFYRALCVAGGLASTVFTGPEHERINTSRMKVPITETTIDPRQPRRLE